MKNKNIITFNTYKKDKNMSDEMQYITNQETAIIKDCVDTSKIEDNGGIITEVLFNGDRISKCKYVILVTPSYSYNSNSPWDLSGISIRNKSGDLIHYDDLPLEDKHPGGYWDIDKEKYYYNFESYFIGKVYPGHSSGICISEYSLLDFTTQFKGVPSGSRPHLRLWNHTWKNLIRYLNTNELLSTEIEKSINWKKIENFRDKYQVFCTNNRKDNSDKTIKDIEHYNLDEQSEVNKGLSIEEAKEGLSIKFDIPQENIEILIKG